MLSYHKRNASRTTWKSRERIFKNSIVLSVMLRHVLSFFAAVDGVPPEPADCVGAEP